MKNIEKDGGMAKKGKDKAFTRKYRMKASA